jgi:hypothetical protein
VQDRFDGSLLAAEARRREQEALELLRDAAHRWILARPVIAVTYAGESRCCTAGAPYPSNVCDNHPHSEVHSLHDPVSFDELRRSPRVALRIPLGLRWEGQRFTGSTLIVNSHGALVYAQRNVTMGDMFELESVPTRSHCHCRVVWQSGLDQTGFFKLGVEMLEPNPLVWGSEYAMELARQKGSSN